MSCVTSNHHQYAFVNTRYFSERLQNDEENSKLKLKKS